MTIGEMCARGHRLAMRCPDCARLRYLRTDRFGPDQSIAAIQITCSVCRSEAARAIVVERDAISGHWPAESSG